MAWIKAASKDEIPVGGMKMIPMQDDDVAVYHAADGYYATSDICTHASQSLTQGTLNGHIVACPKHGGKFDIRTGVPTAFPCVIPIQTYPVDVRDGDVWVEYE